MVKKVYAAYENSKFYGKQRGIDIGTFFDDLKEAGFKVLEYDTREVKPASRYLRALRFINSVFLKRQTRYRRTDSLKVSQDGKESSLVLHCEYFKTRPFIDDGPTLCPTFVRSVRVDTDEKFLRDITSFFEERRNIRRAYEQKGNLAA